MADGPGWADRGRGISAGELPGPLGEAAPAGQTGIAVAPAGPTGAWWPAATTAELAGPFTSLGQEAGNFGGDCSQSEQICPSAAAAGESAPG